ncbi:DUF6461 domain-containing protein [Streptomyces sp. NPDC048386]|uniref:DUF6461 domain-containing protein n=1 Tax=Streptomyces sp. NPDC048386 TaxID=3365541 RepID=UPI00371DD1B3
MVHLFHWFEDSELRTALERPSHRPSSTPDVLNAVMRPTSASTSGMTVDLAITHGYSPRWP